jgi:hypothetical protein
VEADNVIPLRRRLCRFPRLEALPPSDRNLAERIGAVVDELKETVSAGTPPPASFCFSEQTCVTLRHPLSAAFSEQAIDDALEQRRLAEIAVMHKVGPDLAEAIAARDATAFLAAVAETGFAFTGVRGWRKATARTAPDSSGYCVEFPPWHTIDARLAALLGQICCIGETSIPLAAMAGLVGFTHCHPFEDGNGRTARVLFNTILHLPHRPDQFYVPVGHAARQSQGGYILSVREAELTRNWGPMLRFTLGMVSGYLRRLREDQG